MNEKLPKPSVLFTPSGCLTGDSLMAYVSGKLKKPAMQQALKHVESCQLCADAAEGA